MEVNSQLRVPAALPLGKVSVTHWIGGWVGPAVGLEAVVKRKIHRPAGNRTPEQ